MAIEEILVGESKNIEFKVRLPKDSEKYTKTIIAFANTQGGQLIVGIDDETRKVVGVDQDSVFKVADSMAKMPKVTRTQLVNWNIIKKTEDGYLASNAFALLTGKYFHYSKTQCAVFAGTERGEFIDKQEYDGTLYEQIEGAYAFVLRNIRHSAKVDMG